MGSVYPLFVSPSQSWGCDDGSSPAVSIRIHPHAVIDSPLNGIVIF